MRALLVASVSLVLTVLSATSSGRQDSLRGVGSQPVEPFPVAGNIYYVGANGISGEYQSMRHMCNLETVDTYEGTYEIHTLIVGHDLTGIPAYE